MILQYARPPYFSIHAPLTRGDDIIVAEYYTTTVFNPRPSHEGRPKTASRSVRKAGFQSTPLSRGATHPLTYLVCHYFIFNPRPSHEGRLNHFRPCLIKPVFNPRPSHEGRRASIWSYAEVLCFQSTPLSRGATLLDSYIAYTYRFSIHAPLTRGDFRQGRYW